MENLLAEGLTWAVTWLPWLGLTLAICFLVFGVLAMDDEGDIGRDFILLSIAVSLITGLFITVAMV